MLNESLLLGFESMANLFGYKMEKLSDSDEVVTYEFYKVKHFDLINQKLDDIWIVIAPSYILIDIDNTLYDSRQYGYEEVVNIFFNYFQ